MDSNRDPTLVCAESEVEQKCPGRECQGCVPSFGSSMDSLLLMVVGWVVFSFLPPSSTHIANFLRGSPLQAPNTAAHSGGADQASHGAPPARAECPAERVWVHRGLPGSRRKESRVPCLLKLEPSRKPLPTFTGKG